MKLAPFSELSLQSEYSHACMCMHASVTVRAGREHGKISLSAKSFGVQTCVHLRKPRSKVRILPRPTPRWPVLFPRSDGRSSGDNAVRPP